MNLQSQIENVEIVQLETDRVCSLCQIVRLFQKSDFYSACDWLDDKKFEINAGDSFQFQNEKYRWENPTDEIAEAIWVISPPVY